MFSLAENKKINDLHKQLQTIDSQEARRFLLCIANCKPEQYPELVTAIEKYLSTFEMETIFISVDETPEPHMVSRILIDRPEPEDPLLAALDDVIEERKAQERLCGEDELTPKKGLRIKAPLSSALLQLSSSSEDGTVFYTSPPGYGPFSPTGKTPTGATPRIP